MGTYVWVALAIAAGAVVASTAVLVWVASVLRARYRVELAECAREFACSQLYLAEVLFVSGQHEAAALVERWVTRFERLAEADIRRAEHAVRWAHPFSAKRRRRVLAALSR
ncbi:hypothetical protein SAMN05421810_101755 [Amycolatopsis arida]|uniref:Uncharacterized protein n=2 Tax=Amycolatopsis arida TaxID=587909 RepID=A0A1I5M315_9PSEU|nr:hypothetical protein CLV69_104388 [Amycolatopsis arida]SFP03421.1 hypothetical protein SAMN05421810_101755 [Amycolatopsis arida]